MPRSASLLVLAALAAAGCSPDLWSTPDQRGDRLLREGRAEEAARAYEDPFRRGVAHYRAKDFEAAAAEFGRAPTPEGAFDRGNALVLLGRYEDAIASYDAALAARPGWREAGENRAIALVRKERLAPSEDDAGGTGGKLEADDFVIDGKSEPGDVGEPIEVGDGDRLAQDELQALWLRRVETKPADFLRAKFAQQFARASEPPGDTEEEQQR
ncbi:MAG: tetratricopeptide repeat protein [Planctomycetota bacterium]